MPAVKITNKPVSTPGDQTHFLVTQPELPEGYAPTGQETEEELAELKVESLREIEMDDMVEHIQGKFAFDSEPTAESGKPVTSAGIKAALDSVDTEIGELKENLDDVNNEIFDIVSHSNIWTDPGAYRTGTGVAYTVDNHDYSFTIKANGANKGAIFYIPDFDASEHVGENVTFSAILKSKVPNGSPTVRLNALTSDFETLYGSTTYQNTLYTTNRKSETMPIPENARYIMVGLYSGSSSNVAGDTWIVSDIQVELGSTATEYHPAGDSKISKIDGLIIDIDNIDDRVTALEDNIDFPLEYNDRIFTGGRFFDVYNPYKDGGQLQLKGQLHCHATSNDGSVLSTPAQLYNNYKTKYDFMVLTDYAFTADFTRYDDLVDLNDADDDYDLIQLCKGYELKIVGDSSVKQYHMIVLNLGNIDTFATGIPPQDVIDQMTAKGGVVDFPHLTYSGYTADDMEGINVRFTEVISDSTTSESQWDALLTNGVLTFGLGVSDCHGTSKSAIESAYIEVFADNKSRMSILESILTGNFYATSGAIINSIEINNNTLEIVTNESATVVFSKEDGTVLSTVTGSRATYIFDGTEKYVRAKVTTSAGVAWTQPIFLSKPIVRL